MAAVAYTTLLPIHWVAAVMLFLAGGQRPGNGTSRALVYAGLSLSFVDVVSVSLVLVARKRQPWMGGLSVSLISVSLVLVILGIQEGPPAINWVSGRRHETENTDNGQ
jgi:hypothetical protein